MKKAFYAIAFAIGFVLAPIGVDAYTGSGKCWIANDFADRDAMTIAEGLQMDVGNTVLVKTYIFGNNIVGTLVNDGGPTWYPIRNAMANPQWTDPAEVPITSGNLWTETDQEFTDFCNAGHVWPIPPPSPSTPSTLMPLASSTALVSDINGRYGWLAFSAIAGFMGMLFVWNVVVFAYNRIRKQFEPNTKDDITVV